MDNLCLLQAFGQLSIPRNQTIIDQEFLIDWILDSQHFHRYPPSLIFQKSFYKWVIQTIEASGEEVDERIYERYMSLLPPSSRDPFATASAPSRSYTTYIIRVPPESQHLLHHARQSLWPAEWTGLFSATLLESRKTIEQGTTGFRTWQPSLLLADWLIRNPSFVRGRVLELGCGVGLLGIVVAALQQRMPHDGRNSLCMTDVAMDVLDTCRRNVVLPANGVSGHTSLTWCPLDWREALPSAEGRNGLIARVKEINPEIIIGADLVYDLSIVPALAHLLSLLVTHLPEPPEILLAISKRRETTFDSFVEAIEDVNLRTSVGEFRPLKETVFASQSNDVDKDAIIKLVRVFAVDTSVTSTGSAPRNIG